MELINKCNKCGLDLDFHSQMQCQLTQYKKQQELKMTKATGVPKSILTGESKSAASFLQYETLLKQVEGRTHRLRGTEPATVIIDDPLARQ